MPNTNHTKNPEAPAVTTRMEATSLLVRAGDLPGSPEARQFTGAEHGGVPISLFLVDDRPGSGPLLHRHPYPELFIIHAGQAEFEIDGTRLIATTGDVLVAPARTAHRFTNTGDEPLRLTAIHAAPNMDTEWLQSAQRTNGTSC